MILISCDNAFLVYQSSDLLLDHRYGFSAKLLYAFLPLFRWCLSVGGRSTVLLVIASFMQLFVYLCFMLG